MSMFDEQRLRTEMDYRYERARGRRSAWARTEGRSDATLRRGWARLRRPDRSAA